MQATWRNNKSQKS